MSEIKLDVNNVRVHDQRNREAIRESLEALGAGRSIVIDNDDSIIAGNGVFAEADALGIPIEIVESDGTKLIVVKRTDLASDDPKRTALAVGDNRLSDLSSFDSHGVAELLGSLPDGLSDIAGFTSEELAELLPKEIESQEEFPEYDEDLEASYKCPKCSYEWSGKAGGSSE